MYNRKYRLDKVEEFNGHNPIYEYAEGCVCYPAYLNVGERGWFLYEGNDLFNTPHRIHTSTVKSVGYNDNEIVVETQNTRLTFVLISD